MSALLFALPFAPQRCSECGERFPLSHLLPITADDKFAGFLCLRCDGETGLVECGPEDVGLENASTQLRLPAYDVNREHDLRIRNVRVEGAYL